MSAFMCWTYLFATWPYIPHLLFFIVKAEIAQYLGKFQIINYVEKILYKLYMIVQGSKHGLNNKTIQILL